MKKSVIAAAVAAILAVPAVAMADVTVSGGLQAELRSVGGDGVTMNKGLYATDAGQTGSENGGSYGFLKFSAAEDLGNGMKALAMWNGVANVGDSHAAGGITGRDAYVGLAGGWGAVLAGTLSTPYKSSTVGWDPFLTTSMQARGNGGMSDAQNGYASNALAYAGSFGGVKVVAAMVLDEGNKLTSTGAVDTTSKDTNGKNAISFSVNAPVGPVELALAYVDASKFSNISDLGLSATSSTLANVVNATNGVNGTYVSSVASLDTLTATKVGAKWASGDFTVAGQYEMLELKLYGATSSIKPTVYDVMATYAMGNNTLAASVGTTHWDITGADDTKYMAIGAFHHFSKTTTAWIGYRSTDLGNMPGAATEGTGANAGKVATVGASLKKETSLSLGLRVAF